MSEKWFNLKVWQKAHELVILTYKLTDKFPKDEMFGLMSQMRRAAVSVASNIVEGSKRTSAKDRVHFHTIASGSLEELKYQYVLSRDLNFLTEQEQNMALDTARHVGVMLTKLTNTLI